MYLIIFFDVYFINIKLKIKNFTYLIIFLFLFFACKKEGSAPVSSGQLQLISAKIGTNYLDVQSDNKDMPIGNGIVIQFNSPIDTINLYKRISLTNHLQNTVNYTISYLDEYKGIVISPISPLVNLETYTLQLSPEIKGKNGESFAGVSYKFSCIAGRMVVENLKINGVNTPVAKVSQNIDFKQVTIEISFSQAINASNFASFFSFSKGIGVNASISTDNKTVRLSNLSALKPYTQYTCSVSSQLTSNDGFVFDGLNVNFYTSLDSTNKFPVITDDELLTLVQKQTLTYFWQQAHPSCGLARERNSSGDIVTIGGSGFGVMAMVVAMERGFITRSEGLARLSKIVSFLETCDRYHGAWPHWVNGSTGKIIPFSPDDNGGDLVETSFMTQGLTVVKQYLNAASSEEKKLKDRITSLLDGVEYDWYSRGQNVLYWHWSPTVGWAKNMKLQGYNETLITYVMAATSTTHTITAEAYTSGYTRNGAYRNGRSFYGIKLPLGEDYGGPLFFTHYSFLGLDPRHLRDAYVNYWEQNVNQSLINYEYCKANPKAYVGYNGQAWGLTASDNATGYSAHSPTNDLGVITPTAALSAFPYTPTQSMAALKQFYYILGDKLWGSAGFYDAYDVHSGWWANSYLAIDQGPIICMIENYRTGLLWNLFMSAPEVTAGLDKLGFSYK